MTWKEISTAISFFAYYKNDPNEATEKDNRQTGWHFIPNRRFKNCMTMSQFQYIINTYSRIKPVEQTDSLSHSIPLASMAAVGNQGEIVAFNNTLYSLIYQDRQHFTIDSQPDFPMENPEGEEMGTTSKAKMLEQFTEKGNGRKLGIEFSPLYDAEHMKILYPGNNGCEIKWHVDDCDKHIYKNMSNGGFNWRYKDIKSANYILPDEIVTIHQEERSKETLPVQLRHGSNKKIAYMKPIPNILVKVLPIIAPSTCKLLPHYCKVLITIKMKWLAIKHGWQAPLYNTPVCKYTDENYKYHVMIPGTLNISEEHEYEQGENWEWLAPDGTTKLPNVDYWSTKAEETTLHYYENNQYKTNKIRLDEGCKKQELPDVPATTSGHKIVKKQQ